jgi:hypothetical protein
MSLLELKLVSLRCLLSMLAFGSTLAFGRYGLTPNQEKAVNEWLSGNPDFRAATDNDCACAKSLATIRTGAAVGDHAVPDYDPYRVAGDFNKDGFEDIAVVVLTRSNPTSGFALLLFNQDAEGRFALAYLSRGWDLRGQGLFFGHPARGDRLQLGRFYSPLIWFVPKGRTYEIPVAPIDR